MHPLYTRVNREFNGLFLCHSVSLAKANHVSELRILVSLCVTNCVAVSRAVSLSRFYWRHFDGKIGGNAWFHSRFSP